MAHVGCVQYIHAAGGSHCWGGQEVAFRAEVAKVLQQETEQNKEAIVWCSRRGQISQDDTDRGSKISPAIQSQHRGKHTD